MSANVVLECTKLLTDAQVVPTAAILESMSLLPTKEKRAAFVAEMAQLGAGSRVPPARSAAQRQTDPPATGKTTGAGSGSGRREYKPGEMTKAFHGRGAL